MTRVRNSNSILKFSTLLVQTILYNNKSPKFGLNFGSEFQKAKKLGLRSRPTQKAISTRDQFADMRTFFFLSTVGEEEKAEIDLSALQNSKYTNHNGS